MDGSLRALCRSKHGVIVETTSRDEGRSWSALKKTSLPNNNSGIEALTLRDGRHLLLYNHLGGEDDEGWGPRDAIHLAISVDGKSWRVAALIEKAEKGEFSYPAMIQAKDGRVHLTYTWNRTRIRHLVVDPAALVVGAEVNGKAWPE